MPHTGSKELASANMFVPVLQRCYFIVGFCKTLAKLPARTAFSRTRFQTALSKLRAPRPMPLCALGSGEDIMSSAARWSWKRRAFYAIINCSAQECDTSSTTNNEGDHCGRQEGGCQNSTTSSVEYSNLGSKTDVAEASVSIWGPAGYYSENAGPLVHEMSPVPRILAWCHHCSEAKNGQKVLVLPSMIAAKDPRRQGALSPFCLTSAVIISLVAGLHSD